MGRRKKNRRSLRRAWEVAVVHPRIEVDDTEIDGALLVVDRKSGQIVHLGVLPAGTEPAVELQKALDKADVRAPRQLLCRSQALAAAFEGLGRITVRQFDRLPALERAEAGLMAEMGGPAGPGFESEVESWRGALLRLQSAAPWRLVGDDVEFTFRRFEPLQDAVALVLGALGIDHGLVVYPTRADRDNFRVMARSRQQDGLSDIETWNASLEAPGDVTRDEIRRCRALDLELPGPSYPRVYTLHGGALVHLPEDKARLLRIAVRAVASLVLEHSAALEAGQPVQHEVEVEGHRFEVHATGGGE